MQRRKASRLSGFAGKVPLQDHPEMNKYFDLLLAIGNQPTDLETAMKYAASNSDPHFHNSWKVPFFVKKYLIIFSFSLNFSILNKV